MFGVRITEAKALKLSKSKIDHSFNHNTTLQPRESELLLWYPLAIYIIGMFYLVLEGHLNFSFVCFSYFYIIFLGLFYVLCSDG
jgi:hypothetical protein